MARTRRVLSPRRSARATSEMTPSEPAAGGAGAATRDRFDLPLCGAETGPIGPIKSSSRLSMTESPIQKIGKARNAGVSAPRGRPPPEGTHRLAEKFDGTHRSEVDREATYHRLHGRPGRAIPPGSSPRRAAVRGGQQAPRAYFRKTGGSLPGQPDTPKGVCPCLSGATAACRSGLSGHCPPLVRACPASHRCHPRNQLSH
jgi:hypothetical protein